MFKDAGYDEFLAEKIRLGEEALEAGQIVSKEEMNARVEKLFAKLAEEQRLREDEECRGIAMYG